MELGNYVRRKTQSYERILQRNKDIHLIKKNDSNR